MNEEVLARLDAIRGRLRKRQFETRLKDLLRLIGMIPIPASNTWPTQPNFPHLSWPYTQANIIVLIRLVKQWYRVTRLGMISAQVARAWCHDQRGGPGGPDRLPR